MTDIKSGIAYGVANMASAVIMSPSYMGGQIEHFVSYSANFFFVWQKYYKKMKYANF